MSAKPKRRKPMLYFKLFLATFAASLATIFIGAWHGDIIGSLAPYHHALGFFWLVGIPSMVYFAAKLHKAA
jgi:hypothetical protein